MDEQSCLEVLTDCMRRGSPLVLLYQKPGDTRPTARVVVLDKLDQNQKGEWYFRGHDSLRREVRSFSLREVLDCHALIVADMPTDRFLDDGFWADEEQAADRELQHVTTADEAWADFKFNRPE